jgi:hypothetical protein
LLSFFPYSRNYVCNLVPLELTEYLPLIQPYKVLPTTDWSVFFPIISNTTIAMLLLPIVYFITSFIPWFRVFLTFCFPLSSNINVRYIFLKHFGTDVPNILLMLQPLMACVLISRCVVDLSEQARELLLCKFVMVLSSFQYN